jgi:hypothetical protein
LREIGFVAPQSWPRAVAVGILFGMAFKAVMKALVMPLFGAAPVNPAYHYLAGNAPAAAFMAVFVIVSGGFGEETLYRGFLFEQFSRLFGLRAGLPAKPLALLVATIWFAAVHYPDQGLAGAEQAAVTGFVFGAIFLMTRSLFYPHAGACSLRLDGDSDDLLGSRDALRTPHFQVTKKYRCAAWLMSVIVSRRRREPSLAWFGRGHFSPVCSATCSKTGPREKRRVASEIHNGAHEDHRVRRCTPRKEVWLGSLPGAVACGFTT